MLQRRRQEGEKLAKSKGLIYHGAGVFTGYTSAEVESHKRFKKDLATALVRMREAKTAYEAAAPNPAAVRGSWRIEKKRNTLKRKYGDAKNHIQGIKHKRHRELCEEAKKGGRVPPTLTWMGASCTMASRRPSNSPPKLGSCWKKTFPIERPCVDEE